MVETIVGTWSVQLAFEDFISEDKELGVFDEAVSQWKVWDAAEGAAFPDEKYEQDYRDSVWETQPQRWETDLDGWAEDLAWRYGRDTRTVVAEANAILSDNPFATIEAVDIDGTLLICTKRGET